MNSFLPSQLKHEKYGPYAGAVAAAAVLYSTARLLAGSGKTQKDGLKQIPVPGSSYPYIGHLLSLGNQPGRQIGKWHDELNSPIIKVKMGVQEWIMIADPYLAHKIFVTNGAHTSARPFNTFCTTLYSCNQKGISYGEGKDWKAGRSAFLTVLSPNAVGQYMDVIEREASLLTERLVEATEKDGSVYPISFLQLNALNVVCSVSVGKSYKTVEDPEFKEIAHMIEVNMLLAGADKDLPSFLPILSPIGFLVEAKTEMKDHIVKIRDPLLKRLISEANVRDGPNIFKRFNEENFPLDDESKLVILNDLLSGGMDTGSTTLSWYFALLVNHPEVQEKIFNELDKFINANGRLPSFSDREETPYCLSVMKECMRLKPTTPFGLPHEATSDFIVDDYLIPKGATLLCSMDKIHRSEAFYPRANEFVPDRFMNDPKLMNTAANGKIHERDQFNFGFGRRICPGIYLAEVEMYCAFISVFSNCRIDPVKDYQGNNVYPDVDDVLDNGIVQSPAPHKIKFVKRQATTVA